MTLQDKLVDARTLLETHNNSLEGEEGKIDIESFFTKLRKLGGTSESALSAATWEDLEDCGLPRILARRMSGVFREAEKPTEQKVIVVNDDPVKQAEMMTPAELVTKYDHKNPLNPFGKKLKEISSGQRFVVFRGDGTVNVETSQKLLAEILDAYPERNEVIVDGEVHRTYVVGDRPSRYVDEHPLYPGTLLRPDGTSDTDVNWMSLPLNVRQLLYIAVRETHEINMSNTSEIDLYEKHINQSFVQIARRYKKAAIRYKDLSETNQLPQLKKTLGNKSQNGPQNPFTTGHKVW
jgi:hypothetical protein